MSNRSAAGLDKELLVNMLFFQVLRCNLLLALFSSGCSVLLHLFYYSPLAFLVCSILCTKRRSAIVARIRLREEWSELKGPEEGNPKQPHQIPEIIRKQHKPMRSASKLVSQKIKYTKKTVSQKKSPKMVFNDQTNAKPERSKNLNTQESMMLAQKNVLNASMDILRGVVALVEVGTETRALALRAALTAMGATVLPAWSPLVTHLIWTEGGCRATRARARALACLVLSPLWVEACAGAGRRVAAHAFPAAARASDLPSPRALRLLLKRAEAENIPLSHLLNGAEKDKEPRLRIASESEHDTSADSSADTSLDKSADTTDPESRVNALPRGAPAPPKSRRKLFTQKEAEVIGSTDDAENPAKCASQPAAVSRAARRELARAERMARRLLGQEGRLLAQDHTAPRIVLTGMSRAERQAAQAAIRALGGRVHKHVTARTTHVLLGFCRHQLGSSGDGPPARSRTTCSGTPGAAPAGQIPRCEPKARTLNALLGGARGCRVLHAQWVLDSLAVKKWLHHHAYEVNHLKKISQKARVERAALGRTCSEYAYDIFSGMRVRISPQTEQRVAATQLLTLCGGVVQNGDPSRDGGDDQDGGQGTADCDIHLGISEGEVSSKWVFDSVAAGRMRTTRRYINGCEEGNE